MKKKQPYEKFSGVTTNTAIYYHGVDKPDQPRLLTDEQTRELSAKLIHIINKWFGTASTEEDYSKISPENEIHQLYMNEVLPGLVAARIEALIEDFRNLSGVMEFIGMHCEEAWEELKATHCKGLNDKEERE